MRSEFLRILGGPRALERLYARHLAAENLIEGGYGITGLGRRSRRVQNRDPDRFEKAPSKMGTELMNSGLFGDPVYLDKLMKKKVASRILDREIAGGTHYQRHFLNKKLAQVLSPRKTNRWQISDPKLLKGMLPSSNADTIIHYDNRCYS